MMKRFFPIILAALLFSACLKEEPLNAECDIEEAWIGHNNPTALVDNECDTLVKVLSTDTVINFYVSDETAVSALKIFFTLTPGATIHPANGSSQDFTQGDVAYTVTSEDRQHQRRYHVRCLKRTYTIPDTLRLDFEYFRLDASQSYYEWYELFNGQEINFWGTANAAYHLTNHSAQPEAYPTIPIEEGHSGHGVLLTTLSTGTFGAMAHRPIAGGNLFIGSFDLGPALTNTLQCTLFGYDFNRQPNHISGYYKYAPGATVTDGDGNVLTDSVDAGVFTAVFYRNHDADGNRVTLHGDDIDTSPYIVARAKISRIEATASWTRFDLDMHYEQTVDADILTDWGYSFTITASSSHKAAYYQGAVGSQLTLDEIRITCK